MLFPANSKSFNDDKAPGQKKSARACTPLLSTSQLSRHGHIIFFAQPDSSKATRKSLMRSPSSRGHVWSVIFSCSATHHSLKPQLEVTTCKTSFLKSHDFNRFIRTSAGAAANMFHEKLTCSFSRKIVMHFKYGAWTSRKQLSNARFHVNVCSSTTDGSRMRNNRPALLAMPCRTSN